MSECAAGGLALVQPRVGIGDMVWHLPHIRALAHAFDGRVTLIARPRSQAGQLVGPEDGISNIFWVQRDQWTPGGRHQGPCGLVRLVEDLRERRFDAVVLLTRSRVLALATAAAGIPFRWGYGIRAQRLLLNQLPYLPDKACKLHPYDQATAWLTAAGITLAEPEPRLHISDEARTAARARLDPWCAAPVVLGIASSDVWKQWPALAFAELAVRLLDAGWPALVLIGGLAERAVAEAILWNLGSYAARVMPVLGWPLREVAALLCDAAFYVGNDTAALNIAAAVGTRAYGLFGGTPVLHHSPNIVAVVPPGGPHRDTGMALISVTSVLNKIASDRGAIGPQLRVRALH